MFLALEDLEDRSFDFVRYKALVQSLSKILWSFGFSSSYTQYPLMKFISEPSQKTCFCKRAVLRWQILKQSNILVFIIRRMSLDTCIVLDSVCFNFVSKEECWIWRTDTWKGQRWEGESPSQYCSRMLLEHCCLAVFIGIKRKCLHKLFWQNTWCNYCQYAGKNYAIVFFYLGLLGRRLD